MRKAADTSTKSKITNTETNEFDERAELLGEVGVLGVAVVSVEVDVEDDDEVVEEEQVLVPAFGVVENVTVDVEEVGFDTMLAFEVFVLVIFVVAFVIVVG